VRIALSPSETWTTVEVSLKDPADSDSSIITSQTNINFDNGAARVVFHFENGEVKLWYPVGYGEQPLYEVQVRIYDDVRSLLTVKKVCILKSSV
jgi:beta-mannosidase